MTFEKLNNLIKQYNIPQDVSLKSNSGWECDETEMDGVYYNKTLNVIVFTQEFSEHEDYYTKVKWTELK